MKSFILIFLSGILSSPCFPQAAVGAQLDRIPPAAEAASGDENASAKQRLKKLVGSTRLNETLFQDPLVEKSLSVSLAEMAALVVRWENYFYNNETGDSGQDGMRFYPESRELQKRAESMGYNDMDDMKGVYLSIVNGLGGVRTEASARILGQLLFYETPVINVGDHLRHLSLATSVEIAMTWLTSRGMPSYDGIRAHRDPNYNHLHEVQNWWVAHSREFGAEPPDPAWVAASRRFHRPEEKIAEKIIVTPVVVNSEERSQVPTNRPKNGPISPNLNRIILAVVGVLLILGVLIRRKAKGQTHN